MQCDIHRISQSHEKAGACDVVWGKSADYDFAEGIDCDKGPEPDILYIMVNTLGGSADVAV